MKLMTKGFQALFAATLLLFAASCSEQVSTIDVKEYAAGMEVQPGEDYTPVITDILARHPAGQLKLVFPKGEYHFYDTYAPGKYHAITNHDNLYRRFVFLFKDMADIEIDGQDSDFIFHGKVTPFLVENTSKVHFHNFSIDWEVPFYVQAAVVASDPETNSCELKFSDFSKMEFENGRVNFYNNGIFQPFLGEIMVFDNDSRKVTFRSEKYCHNLKGQRQEVLTPLENGNYRFTAPFVEGPAPENTTYVFKGHYYNNRLCPAIHVIGSKDFEAVRINIYHAGGMGVIAEKSENLHLDQVNVCLREGTDRMVTTTADATHFCNCKGSVIIENCLFENMLDDAANVHGTYLKVEKVLDSRTVLAKLSHPHQFGYHFAEAGDSLQLIQGKTLLPKCQTTVRAVVEVNDVYTRIMFNDEIADQLEPGDGLENISWYPEFIFRNNIVRRNRSRSILVSTPRKALVEGNSFSSTAASILIEGDLDHWHESGAIKDLTIRGNVFNDIATCGNFVPAIFINPHVKKNLDGQYFERNIVIEDNVFKTFDHAVMCARSVDGLVFRNNHIELSGNYPPLFPQRPEIFLDHCTNVEIAGNEHVGDEPARIQLHQKMKASDVRISGNKGFAE